MIVIVDYGMGNITSIQNMLRKAGFKASISSNLDEINAASRLILPGVGAFDTGMTNLQNSGFLPLLNKKVLEEKTPVLGICLGLQLLTKSSEEGVLPGLGWVEARTIRFQFSPDQNNLKVPHMGWNHIKLESNSPLWKDMFENPRFYFVHSYYVVCDRKQDILCSTSHGFEFISGIQKGNIIGVQFHPEKSHKFGLQLLKNFAETPLDSFHD